MIVFMRSMRILSKRARVALFTVTLLVGLVPLASCDRDAAPVVAQGQDVTNVQQSPAQLIGQRADARWKALIDRNFAAAYEYESPSYRATVSPQQYQAQFGTAVRWLDVKVDSVTVSPAADWAEVKVLLQYEAPLPDAGTYTNRRPLFERWIAAEGGWWYVRN